MTIRTAIMEAILGYMSTLSIANGQVYNTRLYKVPDENLPAVFVNILSDTVDYDRSTFSGGAFKQMRVLEVEFVVKAIGTDGSAVAGILDTVTSDIEFMIYENKTLGIGVRDFRFQSTEYAYGGDSDNPRGSATLSATVLYQMQEPESFFII